MIEAYKAYRSMGHRVALQRQSNQVPAEGFATERDGVTGIWARYLGTADTEES